MVPNVLMNLSISFLSKTCWSKSSQSKSVVCKLPHHRWNSAQLQAVRDLQILWVWQMVYNLLPGISMASMVCAHSGDANPSAKPADQQNHRLHGIFSSRAKNMLNWVNCWDWKIQDYLILATCLWYSGRIQVEGLTVSHPPVLESLVGVQMILPWNGWNCHGQPRVSKGIFYCCFIIV